MLSLLPSLRPHLPLLASTLVACTEAPTTPPPAVDRVEVTPATLVLASNASYTFFATARDARGVSLARRVISWTSADTSIATVSASGAVTAGANRGGRDLEVDITASTEGQSGSARVTVAQVQAARVALAVDSMITSAGGSLRLDLAIEDLTGAALSGRTVTWVSLDTTIVEVDSSGLVTAPFYAGPDSRDTRVVASLGDLADTVRVIVTPLGVRRVVVSPETLSVAMGSTAALAVQVQDSVGRPLSGRTVVWTASNAAVATVSTAGRVTAVGLGTAVVTAASEEVAESTVVVVRPSAPAKIAMTEGQGELTTVGTTVAAAPSLRVFDRFDNPVPDVAVVFSVIAGGGTVTGDTVLTDARGSARVGRWTLGPAVGVNTLRAAVLGAADSLDVTFTATGTALPVLSIVTTGRAPVTSREIYQSATYRLTESAAAPVAEGVLEIRGRGNSTWEMPKKPYRIRLAASAAVLGMPANRHWVLLANYADKTLVRNEAAFDLSRRMGLGYTPRSRFVEVSVNGQYDGIYQLVEHIRVGVNRIPVPELQVRDTAGRDITGGYVMEIDVRLGEDFCHRTPLTSVPFCVSNPETLLQSAWSLHRTYITDYLNRAEAAVFGADFSDPARGYAAYFDVESLIDHYLIHEWFRNNDAYWSSTYIYKERDTESRVGKLRSGPVWDFDIALGNINYAGNDDPIGWWVRTRWWFPRMFEDPSFAQRVRARWQELLRDGTIDGVLADIRARQDYLGEAQRRNFERWPILNKLVWPNRAVFGSWDGEYDAMVTWLETRRDWMTEALGQQ